ncbi:hypothetical protein A1O1_04941 [Capronia coronata CBS 617.96]|uniref:Uncharacterized protein n=1 Tax=Capronia coronata CBS 617.96 TaxID=1182541 RepID=W9Z0F8_9EURO|nr:uncharacterized protein A1O1_04941 [Capronia coronata CBS 617.96]EXJ88014.1 hypothetical protein A1O1_04941 [Capronia coronata CBS 617.96]
MAPVPMPVEAQAQQGSQASQSATLPISPSLIVGIVILAAFAVIIVIASVFRFCCGNGNGNPGGNRESKKRSMRVEDEANANVDTDEFNPNRPRSAAQLARMKEVRDINNMYAWERARRAKIEIGELSPPPPLMSRRHSRNGTSDAWSSIGDISSGLASGSTSAPHSEIHPVEDHSRAAFFYNTDDPYADSSSRQRLNHLAPPTSARNSYQTSSSVYSSRRQSSVLLPHAVQYPGDIKASSPSPLRHEYEGFEPNYAEESDPPVNVEVDAAHTSTTERMQAPEPRAHARDHFQNQNQNQNPRIIINDNDEEDIVAGLRTPGRARYHEENDDFEPVDLFGGHRYFSDGVQEEEDGMHMRPGPSDLESNLARPRTRPRLDAPLPLPETETESFPAYPTHSHGQPSVSIYDNEQARDDGPEQHDGMNYGPYAGARNDHVDLGYGNQDARDDPVDYETEEQIIQQRARQGSRDGVRTLIQEWERVNGRFVREL